MAKLTPAQWKKLGKRLEAGEKAADLAREYNVSRQAIHLKFNFTPKEVKEVANQIVTAEQSLQKLDKALQIDAVNLASNLLAISNHVSGGAKFGAMTFHRLAGIANQHAQKLDDVDPDPEELLRIAQITEVGNKAATPALNLLSANKDAVNKINDQPQSKAAIMDDKTKAAKLAGIMALAKQRAEKTNA